MILALNLTGIGLAQFANFQLFPRHDSILQAVVISVAVLYVLLMSMPFMPGIEIGLALMLVLGNKGALLVYLCTLIALSLSFLIGRTIPPRHVRKFLDWLHLRRASALVRELEPLDRFQRLSLLTRKAPSRIAPLLLGHLYLTIALALNLPGNALIGGGGGIGLIVGMSKLIPFHAFLGLLVIAVAPVPLWFFMQGL